jgi:transposase
MADQDCCFVGIDWGSQTHHLHVIDSAGAKLAMRRFPHTGEGLAAMADWISTTAGKPPQAVYVAIETPHGPIVECLMERGFQLYAINPKQLDRFRDRLSPAGAKDDRRDAEVLAGAVRTDRHCLRALKPADPVVIELREYSRMAEELGQERVRLSHRLRQQLWRYYPQMIELSDDLAVDWVLDLWTLVPTPAAARRVRESTIARLLKQRRIRSVNAPELLRQLRTPAVPVAAGTAEAARAHIQMIIRQLRVINREIRAAHAQLDALIKQLTAADAQPGQQPEQRDAAILASSPGIGRIVLATLLTEATDALQRRDYHALRCLCGAAPITRQSGKSKIVMRRLAANRRLQNAAYHWAFKALSLDPRSRAKYQALRQRGHGHARALRSVADRLLAVACAMLKTQTFFNPDQHAQPIAA